METLQPTTQKKRKMKFKSYYVVWKPNVGENQEPSEYCLNRTMQYGNSVPGNSVLRRASCLNRTMQYGNK